MEGFPRIFLCRSVESRNFMRLSLQKAAHANLGEAAYRKSGSPVFSSHVRYCERGAPGPFATDRCVGLFALTIFRKRQIRFAAIDLPVLQNGRDDGEGKAGGH